MKHSTKRPMHPQRGSIMLWLVAAAICIIVLAVFGYIFFALQLRPLTAGQEPQTFIVERDSSLVQIADKLHTRQLIRSSWAFETYVHLKGVAAKLQAGSYTLSPSQSTPSIVSSLTKGNVTNSLVTIVPGRRIDQIHNDLINAGFSSSDVATALDPSQYADLPIMAIKPAGVPTLEGLLWPDSFQKGADTTATQIVRQSLTEMQNHFTSDVQAAMVAHNLQPYQGLTLASVVEQEVSKPSDRPQVAQVFLNRLQQGMKLGSDVTAQYGAIAAGQKPNLTYDSPYNTLIHTGIPPTPISTVSASSLDAVAHPAGTNWLYFVTGDNGTTYFSTNYAQHQAYTQQYCHALCGQ